MKYKVASTENAMEYGFRGLLFSVAGDEWEEKFSLDVKPKAGLSKARTLEPISSAKGFITRFHENTEAPKPWSKINGSWESVWFFCKELGAWNSYILWCICTPWNSQKRLSGSARSDGSNNSSWSMPAILFFLFVFVSNNGSGYLKVNRK